MAARGGLFEVASVVADGRSSSGRARSEPRQKYVASSRHERHRASSVPDARTETLILLSCVHALIYTHVGDSSKIQNELG